MTIRLLDFSERLGEVVTEFQAPPGRTSVKLVLTLDPPAEQVGFRFAIEQTLDGVEWWLLAGGQLRDVRKLDAQGLPVTTYNWSIYEQLLRADQCDRRAFATVHDHQFRGQTYRQLALCHRQRLTVETTGPLTYSLDVTLTADQLPEEFRALLRGS